MAYVKIFDGDGNETQLALDMESQEAIRPAQNGGIEAIETLKVLGASLYTYLNFMEATHPAGAEEYENARVFLRTAIMWAVNGATRPE